jgi:hypothetical protein
MHARSLDHLTEHATRRMQQRVTSQTALKMALRWGTRIEQSGATVFVLCRRHLPADLSPADAVRLEATVAMVPRDGAVITTFRCRRVLHRPRRVA